MSKLLPQSWQPVYSDDKRPIYKALYDIFAEMKDFCEDESEDFPKMSDMRLFVFNSNKAFGQCRSGRTGLCLYQWHQAHYIGVNKKFLMSLETVEKAREVILHELVHSMYPTEGHSARWENELNRLAQLYGTDRLGIGERRLVAKTPQINLVSIATKHRTPKYELYCPHCNKVIQKYVNKPRVTYMHTICKTKLEIRPIKED